MEVIAPELIWTLLGLALILVEFALPTFFILFFGIGALTTGLLLWAGMANEGGLPFIVFSVVSVGSLLLLRNRFKSWFAGRSVTTQATHRDDDLIGYRAEVVSGFDETSPGVGRVSYRGAQWDARSAGGEQFASGAAVKIVGREGAILIIERG